jgi:hypothetical protein
LRENEFDAKRLELYKELWPGNAQKGNAPEDHCSGMLNGLQALAQKIGVSVPKLDYLFRGSNCAF